MYVGRISSARDDLYLFFLVCDLGHTLSCHMVRSRSALGAESVPIEIIGSNAISSWSSLENETCFFCVMGDKSRDSDTANVRVRTSLDVERRRIGAQQRGARRATPEVLSCELAGAPPQQGGTSPYASPSLDAAGGLGSTFPGLEPGLPLCGLGFASAAATADPSLCSFFQASYAFFCALLNGP